MLTKYQTMGHLTQVKKMKTEMIYKDSERPRKSENQPDLIHSVGVRLELGWIVYAGESNARRAFERARDQRHPLVRFLASQTRGSFSCR